MLSGGGYEKMDYGAAGGRGNVGYGGPVHNARDGSAGSRTSAGNMSHGSIGSMNVS